MTFGIEINNQDGVLQISDNLINLQLRQVGRVGSTAWASDIRTNVKWANIGYTYTPTFPIVAIYFPDIRESYPAAGGRYAGAVLNQPYHESGSGFTVIAGGYSETKPWEYYVYDIPITDPGGMGIEIYRADSSLACSSANHLLQTTNTFVPGRKYAALMPRGGYNYRDDLDFDTAFNPIYRFEEKMSGVTIENYSGNNAVLPYELLLAANSGFGFPPGSDTAASSLFGGDSFASTANFMPCDVTGIVIP